jgi:hypothetical protein
MADINRRLDALEAAHWRRKVARYCPPGFTPEEFLDRAIRWLELPIEAQQASMPNFTAAELQIIRSWLPSLRRARG